MNEDRCPTCGLNAARFTYINSFIVSQFGWIECTNCGTVFCPESIRKQKLEKVVEMRAKAEAEAVVPKVDEVVQEINSKDEASN